MATKTPGQLIGVIAHETGHIAVARSGEVLRNANKGALLALFWDRRGDYVRGGRRQRHTREGRARFRGL